MSYPKNIVQIRPTKGLVTDITAAEVSPDFWTGGDNVQFRDGFAERVGGYASVYATVQGKIRNLLNAQGGGINYWLYFGLDTVYAVETTNHTDITPTAGLSGNANPNAWTSGLLNGIPFGNNAADEPIYWDLNTANNMAILPDWPTNGFCSAMRAHRYNLFALGYSESAGETNSSLVRWSNSAEPGALPTAWTAAATNDAGSASLSATPGGIIDGLGLRSSLVVYKQHSAYSFDWIGGQYVYDVRPMFVTAGMLNRNCAIEKDGFHYLLSDGDVLLTDGNQAQSLIDTRMRRYLFNQLDQTNYGAAFMVHYATKNEVWVCFPTSGNTFCDAALVIDTSTGNPLGIRDLPLISHAATGSVSDTDTSDVFDDVSATFDTANYLFNQQNFSEANEALVLGKSDDSTPTNGKLFQVDIGGSANGSSISASLNRDMLDLGEPDRVKFVRKIIPHISGTAGVQVSVRVGASMTSEGSITWAPNQTFTIGTTAGLDFAVSGKFISVQFSSTGTDTYTVQGFGLAYELRGYF